MAYFKCYQDEIFNEIDRKNQRDYFSPRKTRKDALDQKLHYHLKALENNFDFKRATKKEKTEWIKRITQLYKID